MKALPHHVSGPGEPVFVRSDSEWTVPEAEIGHVLNSRLELVGYVIDNDMTARDVESANPLYLPQAKICRGTCALGPAITLANEIVNPSQLDIRCRIIRDDTDIFYGETNFAQMHRTSEELVAYLSRDNTFPNGIVLLTRTGIVPPDQIALAERDTVQIVAGPLGSLNNPVRKHGSVLA